MTYNQSAENLRHRSSSESKKRQKNADHIIDMDSLIPETMDNRQVKRQKTQRNCLCCSKIFKVMLCILLFAIILFALDYAQDGMIRKLLSVFGMRIAHKPAKRERFLLPGFAIDDESSFLQTCLSNTRGTCFLNAFIQFTRASTEIKQFTRVHFKDALSRLSQDSFVMHNFKDFWNFGHGLLDFYDRGTDTDKGCIDTDYICRSLSGAMDKLCQELANKDDLTVFDSEFRNKWPLHEQCAEGNFEMFTTPGIGGVVVHTMVEVQVLIEAIYYVAYRQNAFEKFHAEFPFQFGWGQYKTKFFSLTKRFEYHHGFLWFYKARWIPRWIYHVWSPSEVVEHQVRILTIEDQDTPRKSLDLFHSDDFTNWCGGKKLIVKAFVLGIKIRKKGFWSARIEDHAIAIVKADGFWYAFFDQILYGIHQCQLSASKDITPSEALHQTELYLSTIYEDKLNKPDVNRGYVRNSLKVEAMMLAP